MAYNEFDPTKPDGATQSHTDFGTSNLKNLIALRDDIITGRVNGWVQSQLVGGGTVEQPAAILWTNGSLILQNNISWTGSLPTTMTWTFSTDSGSTWTTMGSAQVNTFTNGADGYPNLTASTYSGGISGLVYSLWAKVLKIASLAYAHFGSAATSAHTGLGSMAAQSSTNVSVTGGYIDGTIIGGTTPAFGKFKLVRELFSSVTLAANVATLDVGAYAHFGITPSATTSDPLTIALSNVAGAGISQTIMIEIINGRRDIDGRISWNSAFKWIGGSSARPPDNTLELSGRNLFSATSRDNGARWEIMHLGKGG